MIRFVGSRFFDAPLCTLEEGFAAGESVIRFVGSRFFDAPLRTLEEGFAAGESVMRRLFCALATSGLSPSSPSD